MSSSYNDDVDDDGDCYDDVPYALLLLNRVFYYCKIRALDWKAMIVCEWIELLNFLVVFFSLKKFFHHCNESNVSIIYFHHLTE